MSNTMTCRWASRLWCARSTSRPKSAARTPWRSSPTPTMRSWRRPRPRWGSGRLAGSSQTLFPLPPLPTRFDGRYFDFTITFTWIISGATLSRNGHTLPFSPGGSQDLILMLFLHWFDIYWYKWLWSWCRRLSLPATTRTCTPILASRYFKLSC